MSLRDSLLHKAVKSGDTNAVSSLLAAGADVNEANDTGQTPLIIAIVAGQHECLRPLLRAGADPWRKDNTGLTAIDWAQRKGETQLAQSLQHSESQTRSTASEVPKTVAPEQKPTPPSTADVQRTPVSPEERSRRFIAGLKLRLDEKAGREVPTQPHVSEEKGRPAFETGEKVIAEVLENFSLTQPAIESKVEDLKPVGSTTEPPIEAPPVDQDTVSPKEWFKPRHRRTVEQPEPSIEQTNLPSPPLTEVAASGRKPPEFVKSVEVAKPKPEPQFSSPSLLPKPIRSSKKRMRCPQCGASYDSDLLAYCSYDAAALIDEDAPTPSRRGQTSTPLLWVLVAIVAVAGAVAGLLVTERLLRRPDNEAKTAAAPEPPPPQKGVPVLGGKLEGKALSVPEAKVEANTVSEPTSVLVRVRVDRLGRVYSASSTNNNEVLRDSAVEAAKKASFSVEKLGGRGAEGTITYTFK